MPCSSSHNVACLARLPHFLWAGVFLFLASACSAEDQNASPTPGKTPSPTTTNSGMMSGKGKAPEGALTYHRDVRPIFESRCGSCHIEQNRGGFSMRHDASQWNAGAPAWIASAITHVQQEETPHWWRHDPDCAEVASSYALTPANLDAFTQWIDDGSWPGDEADFDPSSVSVWTPPTENPTRTLEIDAYTPPDDATRALRCFVLPTKFEDQTYLTALGLKPDRRDQIEHITVASLSPEEAQLVVRLDNDNQQPGFDCFGQFSEAKQARNLYAWTPGMPEGITYPDQHAFVLRPGARLVLQIQYAPSQSAREEERPDATALDIWTLPPGQLPEQEVRILPFAQVRIEIEPEEESKTFASEHIAPYPVTILGMTPHMLDFATRFKFESYPIDDNASPNPSCMARFADWDFASSKYTVWFDDEERLALRRGDRFRQSCTYDNSLANQPEPDNGLEPESKKLVWGSSQEHEMCINHVIVSLPFQESRNVDCSVVPECLEGCQPNDIECFSLCAIRTSVDCTECSFAKLINCAGSKCNSSGLELAQCLKVCDLSNGYGLNCIQDNCAFEWQNFSNCGIEKMTDGTCVLDDCL